MSDISSVRREFIEDFGEGYRSFGLSRLMGHIVGLLLYEEGPLSLDQIVDKLQVSKGPVSQITRRLSESGLIRKVWVPGSRRDHYQAEQEIFSRAFTRQADLFGMNLELSRKYLEMCREMGDEAPDNFRRRIEEMYRFYELMNRHFRAFLDEWDEVRSGLDGAEGEPAVRNGKRRRPAV